MNFVEDFEQLLTLDQAERLVDFDSSQSLERASSTQQLLDELLGRFEDDGLPIFLHGPRPGLHADSDE
ncbi:MAG: hypothetical protein WB558_23210 [Terriglobales bacterium]